jgi:hypothetical protein
VAARLAGVTKNKSLMGFAAQGRAVYGRMRRWAAFIDKRASCVHAVITPWPDGSWQNLAVLDTIFPGLFFVVLTQTFAVIISP